MGKRITRGWVSYDEWGQIEEKRDNGDIKEGPPEAHERFTIQRPRDAVLLYRSREGRGTRHAGTAKRRWLAIRISRASHFSRRMSGLALNLGPPAARLALWVTGGARLTGPHFEAA